MIKSCTVTAVRHQIFRHSQVVICFFHKEKCQKPRSLGKTLYKLCTQVCPYRKLGLLTNNQTHTLSFQVKFKYE